MAPSLPDWVLGAEDLGAVGGAPYVLVELEGCANGLVAGRPPRRRPRRAPARVGGRRRARSSVRRGPRRRRPAARRRDRERGGKSDRRSVTGRAAATVPAPQHHPRAGRRVSGVLDAPGGTGLRPVAVVPTIAAARRRRRSTSAGQARRRPARRHVEPSAPPQRRERTAAPALVGALSVAVADESVAVELRGAGPSFSSGGDLAEFGTFPDPATAHVSRLTRSPGRLVSLLAPRCSAYLHGACMGAGIEVAAFAGRVVADPDAVISLPELGIGLVPAPVGRSASRRASAGTAPH